MTRKQHIARHKKLHKCLDELLADWLSHTGKFLTKTTVMEFLQWSFRQTKNPTERKK